MSEGGGGRGAVSEGGARERVWAVVAAGRRLADPRDPLGRELRERGPGAFGLSAEGVGWALERHLETRPTPGQIDALVASVPPSGRTFVVLSANVFTAALRAVALAAAASPRVVVRPSRREPLFAALLLRALAEGGAPFEISVGDPRGARAGEQVHAYGRDETMAAIRAALAPGVLFWPHGAGVGVAAAGAGEGRAAAWRVALDVVAFDQRGCLSPRVVLVEGDEAAGLGFAGELARALGELAARVPPGADAAEERASRRAYADAMAVAGEVYEGRGYLVGFDPAPRALAWPAGPRAVHVARVGGGPEALGLVAPLARGVAALGGRGPLADVLGARLGRARRSALGRMQRPPLDGPVDRRVLAPEPVR
ncbi:MAG TPA: acyl-CoA reductase [Polyangiaceae bacterium]|nr:acyl-CoA reductase [Polyangiaceae bacterium]